MTEGKGAVRRPLPRRDRRRWAIVGGAVAAWLVFELVSGSMLSASVLLVTFCALGAVAALFLRSMGVTKDHPRIRQLRSRPWRDGQDVLRVATRRLPDVFVITPSGSLLAPNQVELALNPEDLGSLCEQMELGVICLSLTEVYEEQIARSGARQAAPGQASVYVVADEEVPRDRYRLRQGHHAGAQYSNDQYPNDQYANDQYADDQYADDQYSYDQPELEYEAPDAGPVGYTDGWAWREPEPSPTVVDAAAVPHGATVLERPYTPVPVLRLVTGDLVSQTWLSGARAGRGCVELALPDVPTVSREHARFTFSEGSWWVTNLGLNGLMLNGNLVNGERPVGNGDVIQWGSRPDSPQSRVEIG